MRRTWSLIAFIFCLSLILPGCGSGDSDKQTSESQDSNNQNSDTQTPIVKKYLAKNIILNTTAVQVSTRASTHKKGIFSISPFSTSKSYAQDATDAQTQILAENVIYENSGTSQIESSNVQNALEEISQNLADVLPGTWTIQNYNQEDWHVATGKTIINNDGTFQLIEGSFAAIGQGTGAGKDGMCDYNDGTQTYQIYGDGIVSFTYSPTDSIIPQVVKLRKNQITFIGSGGCGQLGRQRISILSRVVE